MNSFASLLNRALTVMSERLKEMNTAARIGGLFKDVITYFGARMDDIESLSSTFATKKDLKTATTSNKGQYDTLLQLNTAWPNSKEKLNEAGFSAIVGLPPTWTIYRVSVDGGPWVNTGVAPLQEEIDLSGYIDARFDAKSEEIDKAFYEQKEELSIALEAIRAITFFSKTVEDGFHICDKNGNCAVSIGEDAITKLNLDIDFTSDLLQSMFENGFAVSDGKGNSSLFVDQKGKTDLRLSKLALKQLKQDLSSLDNIFDYKSDCNHIITYGQSLGEGSQCNPIITSSEFSPFAKMFNHGIKTRYGTSPMYQSFVPHVERSNAENGETPASGTAEMLIISSGIEDQENKYILSSCCAVGAMTIAQLSKGTTWYNNVINDVTNAKRLANAKGQTYRLSAVTWTQGEYDYGNGVAYYKNKLKQLRADIIADVESITGDDYSNLPFITYQVSSSYTASKSYPDVGLALLELGIEEDNGFHMATPIYHLEYADGWHLKNFSSKWMGAYYGYALYNVMKKGDWKPLYPISHTSSENEIYLKFSKTDLKFDKPSYISAVIANRGFSVKDSSNNELIQSVDVHSSDTIKITCSEDPTGLSVTYGFANSNNRNAGELRDNQNVAFTIQGTSYKLYNWCSIFEYKL